MAGREGEMVEPRQSRMRRLSRSEQRNESRAHLHTKHTRTRTCVCVCVCVSVCARKCRSSIGHTPAVVESAKETHPYPQAQWHSARLWTARAPQAKQSPGPQPDQCHSSQHRAAVAARDRCHQIAVTAAPAGRRDETRPCAPPLPHPPHPPLLHERGHHTCQPSMLLLTLVSPMPQTLAVLMLRLFASLHARCGPCRAVARTARHRLRSSAAHAGPQTCAASSPHPRHRPLRPPRQRGAARRSRTAGGHTPSSAQQQQQQQQQQRCCGCCCGWCL